MLRSLPATDQFIPLYYRIQETLRLRIVGGEFQPGDRLPSETELARDYDTTRVTVRHALMRLAYDGLIERKSGRGTFVRDSSSIVSRIDTLMVHSFEQQVALRGKVVTYEPISFGQVPAPQEAAERLSLEEGAQVYRMDRLRKIENAIIGLEIRYLPFELGEQVTSTMLKQQSAHRFLTEITHQPIPVIEVTMTAINAPKWLAMNLDIKRGSAVLVRENCFRNGKGIIVQYGRSYFPGDMQMEYVLGRSAES